MKYFNNKNNIYKKIISMNLKLLIIGTSLFVYKYVYHFKINQEMSFKLFAIILFSLWILKILHNEEYYFKKTNLNLPIFIFILLMTISLLRSQSFMVSLNDYIIFLFYFFIYFLIINNINDKIQFESLIKLFFITATIIAIYALLQYYGFDPYLKELSVITSTVGQKNWVSNYLALIFPIIFSYFLLRGTNKNKIFLYLLLLIIYTALIICQSRGIWISMGLTLLIGIYFIFKFKIFKIFKDNQKWLFLLLVTFLAVTIIHSTDHLINKSAITVTERVISTFDEQDPSINMHLLTWKTTINMIKDKPLFGSGIGTFKINYLDYQARFLKENPEYNKYWNNAKEAHNEFLQLGAELGLIGLGIFVSIIFIFYYMALSFLKKEKNMEKKMILFGLFLGITCFLIHSLFTFPFHVLALGSTFFIILGLTIVHLKGYNLSMSQKENKISKFKPKNLRLKIIFSILIIIFMIFIIDSLVIKPYMAEIYYYKGIKFNYIKNYDKSLYNLDYAARLNPHNGRILHALGATYIYLDTFDKAEEFLQKAKIYIPDIKTFYDLGLLYAKVGLYKKAEEELKHAVYLNPKFYEAYYALGKLYFSQEDYDNAIEQCKKILEIEPNFNNKYIILYDLGIMHKQKKMLDEALEYFIQALQLVPEGSAIMADIEEEIYNIYIGNLDN
jgi:O-antigen ligase/Tfp pilus assembly protein PilF